jgi:hypothetical protein
MSRQFSGEAEHGGRFFLDLQNRRTTRANDLWLDKEDGQLQLSAADTSGRAMVRRLVRGNYQARDRQTLYDWK